MPDAHQRVLEIDGETVTFRVELGGQTGTAGEGGLLPEPEPFLGAVARKGGAQVWEGVLSGDVQYGVPIGDQYRDDVLEQLYRVARSR